MLNKAAPIFLTLFLILGLASCAKRWDILSSREKVTLHRILNHWETWVPERKKKGTAPLLTFNELYDGLRPEEREFLDRVRAIHPRKNLGGDDSHESGPGVRFKKIENQEILKKGESQKIDPQYLPNNVYRACRAMMKAMKHDLGKRLLVESGYRSPAYQLYTFLFYTPKHHYSLAETGRWVALPGFSEHGDPRRQAIDFINEEGINGDDPGQSVQDFEELPEYEWLARRAREFGFGLSYPRGRKDVTFEPWHWRYEGD